ncbi:MAG: RnfABCDGE type electron transport complex subunit C [Bacilli bacterium]|nr:RnfABCDGE type electron transport complex subunit C [Bacilli bacterium]MBQ6282289.1 RnfABCDGE type electron transport complex subunit C [Bacilli bacterium]
MIRGLKIDGKKEMSLSEEIIDFSSPDKVYVPLMNNNTPCDCLVKKGKKVKKGTVIGIRKNMDFPVLSPVSGIVVDIDKCLYLNGEEVPCVVIENDKKETVLKKVLVDDIAKYTKEEFVELLKKCAVTGMGGSDFPTFFKYKSDASFLIVNAVECEPYLTADMMLVKLKAEAILESIDAIRKINNIKKCFIAFKENNDIVRNAFLEYIGRYEDIVLSPVKNIYPMGWERHLVKSVLNLEYERYPSEVGVIVNNVSTIFAIYKALKFQRNITKRIVTITGEGFTEPINVLVKVGTDMSSIIKKIGKYKGEKLKFIAGGPMMGTALSSDHIVVSNNLGAVTIISDTEDYKNECISCSKCVNVCPAKLCPVLIMKNIDNVNELKKLHPELCVECGLCSYVCPSKLGVRDFVVKAKGKVRQ